MDLIPENIRQIFNQSKDAWTRKYKRGSYGAIALIEVNGKRIWRWRWDRRGDTRDWPFNAFSSLQEFEQHVQTCS